MFYRIVGSNLLTPQNETMKKIIPFLLIDLFIFIPLMMFSQWNKVDSLSSVAKDIQVSGNLLYVCTATDGVFVSIDSGFTFTPINIGLGNLNTRTLLIKDSIFLVGTNNSVYKSTNYGATWSLSNSGIPLSPNSNVATMAFYGDSVFVGTISNGLFLSRDLGNTWIPVNNGLPNQSVGALFVYDSIIFAGMMTGGVYVSTDNGNSWQQRNSGLPTSAWMTSFSIIGQTIFVSSDGHGIYKTSDFGLSWDYINPPNYFIWKTYSLGSTLLTCHDGTGISRTDDYGNSWVIMNEGLDPFPSADCDVLSINQLGDYVYIGSWSRRIFRRSVTQLSTKVPYLKKDKILFYPNPIVSCSSFILNNDMGKFFNIEIFNTSGQLVEKKSKIKNDQLKICKLDFSEGLYFYIITDSENTIFKGSFIID